MRPGPRARNPAYDRFLRSTQGPRQYQDALWRRIFQELKDGPHWQKALRRAVTPPPLTDFEVTEFGDYRNAIEDSLHSRISALTGKPIIWWGNSSGTTSVNRKFVPFTQAYYLDALEARAVKTKIFADHLKVNRGFRTLAFTALDPQPMPGSGLPVGLVSAFTRRFVFPDASGAWILPDAIHASDELFRKWAPRYALASEFEMIAATTAAPVLRFLGDIYDHIEEHLAFFSSRKQPPAPLPKLEVNRRRLDYLRHLFARVARPKPVEIWPSLKLLTCWNSGSSAVLLDQVRPYLSSELKVVDWQYASAEGGVIALPSLGGPGGGPVYSSGTIVEFLPVGGKPSGTNLKKMWQLEEGNCYEVILTNHLGFIRYRPGDIVRCTGYFNRVPTIQFSQKRGAAIELGLAYILEADLLHAVRSARPGAQSQWTLAPADNCRGIELIHDGAEPDIETIAGKIESTLRSIHTVYDSAREKGMLKPLQARAVERGNEFWRRFPTHAQAKLVPVLSQPVKLG